MLTALHKYQFVQFISDAVIENGSFRHIIKELDQYSVDARLSHVLLTGLANVPRKKT